MLKGALFPANGLHGIVHNYMLGRIVFLIASSNMILGNSCYPAGNGISLGVICQIIDVVDNILWLAGEGAKLIGFAPIRKIIPVCRIGFQGIITFGFAHTPFAFGREQYIFIYFLVIV